MRGLSDYEQKEFFVNHFKSVNSSIVMVFENNLTTLFHFSPLRFIRGSEQKRITYASPLFILRVTPPIVLELLDGGTS